MLSGSFGSWVLFDWRQVLKELQQVALVIAQSVDADIALVAQVVEELSEKFVEHRILQRDFSLNNLRQLRVQLLSCGVVHSNHRVLGIVQRLETRKTVVP